MTAERSVGKAGRYAVLTLPLYVALAIASTWPLVDDLARSVPRGTTEADTVPLVSAWALWWTSDRIPAGLDGYWDAPILSPTRGVFAHSESMPLLGALAAPVFWLGGTPMLAYNLVLLLALVSNGWMAYGLMRALRLHPLAANLGGAFVLLLPYVHRELGVLTLVPLAGLLGTLWALLVFMRDPSLRRSLPLSLAFAAAYLICAQHTLMLLLAIVPAGAWLVRRNLFRPAALGAVVMAGSISAALIAPVAFAQWEALGDARIERSAPEVARGAAIPSTWLASPWRPLFPAPGLRPAEGVNRRGLFPGYVKLALALLGLAWASRRSEHKRAAAFIATVGATGYLISILPSLGIGDLSLHDWAHSAIPGVAQIRALYRAGVLTQLALALLAAYGLHALLESRHGPLAAERHGVQAGTLLAVALGIIAAGELWPVEQGFGKAPDPANWHRFAEWVEENVGRDEVMAYLPCQESGPARAFEEDARWMALQALHGRPMVNGYSSFAPRSRQRFARGVQGFPNARSHAAMRRAAVRFVVVRQRWLDRSVGRQPAEAHWKRVYWEPEEGVAIYQVLRDADDQQRNSA